MTTQLKPVASGSFTTITKSTLTGQCDKATTAVAAAANGGAASNMLRGVNMWLNAGLIPPPPTLAAAAVATGGTFAAATYFWVITGVTAQGESMRGVEATVAIVLNGSCNLTWGALPAGTTNVKVYRGTVTGQETVLVATLGAVVAYTDTGIAGTPATPPPATPNITIAQAAIKLLAANGQLLQEV